LKVEKGFDRTAGHWDFKLFKKLSPKMMGHRVHPKKGDNESTGEGNQRKEDLSMRVG